MIKHGLLVCLLGLIGGFFFMFSLVGKITFSPLPLEFVYELPGGPSRWRAVHIGNLMNGIMAVAFATVLPQLEMTGRVRNLIAYGTVATVWGNAIFYTVGVLAPNHGVTLGDNRMGESNWAGVVSFIPAYVVAIVLIIVVVLMLRSLPGRNTNAVD